MAFEQTQVSVWASVELDLENLAKAVADADDDDIIDFVLALDERMSELSWTLRLRDRLQEVIDRETALEEEPS